MSTMSVTIMVICTDFPGRNLDGCTDLQVGLQSGKGRTFDLVDAVPGDSAEARFRVELQARQRTGGTVDFSGPTVQGKPGERFFYLTWTSAANPHVPLQRVKVPLHHLSWDAVQNEQIVARLRMTHSNGSPLAATAKEPYLQWHIEPPPQR